MRCATHDAGTTMIEWLDHIQTLDKATIAEVERMQGSVN